MPPKRDLKFSYIDWPHSDVRTHANFSTFFSSSISGLLNYLLSRILLSTSISPQKAFTEKYTATVIIMKRIWNLMNVHSNCCLCLIPKGNPYYRPLYIPMIYSHDSFSPEWGSDYTLALSLMTLFTFYLITKKAKHISTGVFKSRCSGGHCGADYTELNPNTQCTVFTFIEAES